jgi:hypothetical protein
MSDYDTDLLLWSGHQADLLRRRAAGELVNDAELDWTHIAEEIEALGKSDRRELRSRIGTILVHLIKLEVSPAREPRAGWRVTVLEQRAGTEALLADSPSLRPTVARVISDLLDAARTQARVGLEPYGEALRADPDTVTFTQEQVLGPWLP